MLAAVSTALCILSSAFPTMSLTILAICGVVSSLALNVCGYKYAFLMYAAVSLLALILCTDKSCAVYYILLFGHYPMVKTALERISKKTLVWMLKLAFANLLCFVSVLLITYIIGVSGELNDFENPLFWILYNAAFVLYDICLEKIILFYISKGGRKGRFH